MSADRTSVLRSAALKNTGFTGPEDEGRRHDYPRLSIPDIGLCGGQEVTV